MRTLLLVQLLVPALLAAWMLILPPRSRLGVAAQLFASLAALALAARVGLWLFPPWWMPWLAALAVAAGSWRGRRAARGRVPTRPAGWIVVALFLVGGSLATATLGRALLASRRPAGSVDLALPLAAGRYLVVNGGGAVMMNAHRESMDTTVARLRPWRGNGHAVDLVAIDALGLRAPGLLPMDPTRYRIFGAPVLAPCPGSVVAAVDGLPDMPVPEYDRENMAGNHVILDCGGLHVALAHFRRGSVRVRAGGVVEVGQTLGEAGNSGGTSEPHLHVHAQRPGPDGRPFAGDPVPVTFGGRYLVRGNRVSVP